MSGRRTCWACIALQVGRNDMAVEYISQTWLKPDLAEALCNLGMALARLEKLPEAVACYQQALRSSPPLPKPTTTWRMPADSKGN